MHSQNSPLVNTGTSYFNIRKLATQTAGYHADYNQTFGTAHLFLDTFSVLVILSNCVLQAGMTFFCESGRYPACFGQHHNPNSNNMNSVPGTRSQRSVVFDPPDPCSELQGKLKMQPISSTRKFLPDPRLATRGTQDTSPILYLPFTLIQSLREHIPNS